MLSSQRRFVCPFVVFVVSIASLFLLWTHQLYYTLRDVEGGMDTGSSSVALPAGPGILGRARDALGSRRTAKAAWGGAMIRGDDAKGVDAMDDAARRDVRNDAAGLPDGTSSALGGGYEYYKSVALELAGLEPQVTLDRLEMDDPFGTRKFDTELLRRETDLGRVLDMSEIRALFPCPENEYRITLPDVRMESKARDFRNGKRGTFLFFQHLRKVRARLYIFVTTSLFHSFSVIMHILYSECACFDIIVIFGLCCCVRF